MRATTPDSQLAVAECAPITHVAATLPITQSQETASSMGAQTPPWYQRLNTIPTHSINPVIHAAAKSFIGEIIQAREIPRIF